MESQTKEFKVSAIEVVSERIADLRLKLEKLENEMLRARNIGELEFLKLRKEITEQTMKINEVVYEQLRQCEGNEVH